MKASCLSLVACAAMLANAGLLKADFISTATLTPGADGATNSNGSGSLTLDFNPATDLLTYTLSWANLTGNATMAHIHYGAPGVAGPIVLPFFTSPLPATDSIGGTFTEADIIPVAGTTKFSQLEDIIMAGDLYVNIHTAAYPGGELRGQLTVGSSTATPEPSTAGLLLTSLTGSAAFAFFRRRRAIH